MKSMKPWEKILLTLIAIIFGWPFILLFKMNRLLSKPNPCTSFHDAECRINRSMEKEKAMIRQEGRSLYFSHGKKTPYCLVFLHGYTNSPKQFEKLGKLFFNRGHTVYIPRMPHHGLVNNLTKDHAKLTASDLANHADNTIDIAQALGDRVVVLGLSAGGTLTSWIALSRKDVYHSVIISPVFGYYGIPSMLMRPLMYTFLLLPNFFRWWDPENEADSWKLHHVYPRYATRTLAHLLKLGFEIKKIIRSPGSSSAHVTIITNENDQSVNNNQIYHMIQLWRKMEPEKVSTYEFSASLNLDHDLIDPEHENQKTDLVYPVLFDLIGIDRTKK